MERCQATRSGVICGAYGSKTPSYEDEGAIYHRVTIISDCMKDELSDLERQELRGMSSQRSWVAFQGDKSIVFVTPRSPDIARQEKPDLSNIFPTYRPMAAVSMFLGTNEDEVNGGSGIAVSCAKYNEQVAINFLEDVFAKVYKGNSTFTDAEAVKEAISALGYLCHANFMPNDIEIYVEEKGDRTTGSFPRSESEAYFSTEIRSSVSMSPDGSESGCSDSSSLDARFAFVRAPRVNVGPKSMETSNEESKSKIGCNRETHICCGGWDSQLLKSLGFSWITVQGKDCMCVVTQDEVTLGKGFFETVLSHVKDNQLFRFKSSVDQSAKKSSMISPFAAVSVVVGIHEESGHDGASSAEIKAIEFLMTKIQKDSDFTYEATVQTAISALLFLAQKDLNPGEIKALVLRNGEDLSFLSKLPTTEIEEHLWVIKRQRF